MGRDWAAGQSVVEADPSVHTPLFLFAAFVKRHGLPPGGLHALRGSHACWLITRNVHAKEISKRLGHADIGTTMNVYSDAFEEVDRQAAACLDADFRATCVTKTSPTDESETSRPVCAW